MTDDIANMSDEDFKKLMKDELSYIGDEKKDMIMFDNVFMDDSEVAEIHPNEYLAKVFTTLSEKMPNFQEYTFIINSSLSSEKPQTTDLSWMGDKRVLIWLSNEHKYAPMDLLKNNYHHIFANYYWDTENVTSIPLGYYANSKDAVQDELYDIVIPMKERMLNMSFIGCLNKNRLQLSSLISKLPRWLLVLLSACNNDLKLTLVNGFSHWFRPKEYYKFTGEFASGLNRAMYLNILRSSKITLCPRGWSNVESFRIYESMRAGCVTITEKLPDRSYYKDIPAIQVDNWKEGLDLARSLLNDRGGLLTRLGEASRLFYEAKLSPEATAKIIMDKLAEKAI